MTRRLRFGGGCLGTAQPMVTVTRAQLNCLHVERSLSLRLYFIAFNSGGLTTATTARRLVYLLPAFAGSRGRDAGLKGCRLSQAAVNVDVEV